MIFDVINYQKEISDPSSSAMVSITIGGVTFMVCTLEICNISKQKCAKDTKKVNEYASSSSKPFLNVNSVI